MTMINNFDKSSSGINLELVANYDQHHSQHLFDESFKNVWYNSGSLINGRYYNVDLYLWTNYGNFSDTFDLDDLNNYSFAKTQLIEMLTIYSLEDAQDLSKDLFNKGFSKLDKAELIELAESMIDYNDKINLYTEHLHLKAFIVDTRGYSQGDYAEIIIPFESLDQLGVNYKDKDFNIDQWVGNDFDHLFWDSPAYIRLTVNDEDEIDLTEWLECEYTYDKNDLLASLKESLEHEQKDLIIAFLSDNLPTTLDY